MDPTCYVSSPTPSTSSTAASTPSSSPLSTLSPQIKTKTKATNPRVKYDYDEAILRQYYDMTLEDAAKALGTCTATLKRICRRQNITQWPYRALRANSKSSTRKTIRSHNNSKRLPKIAVRTPPKTTLPGSRTLSSSPTSSCMAKDSASARSSLAELLCVASQLHRRNRLLASQRNALFPLEPVPAIYPTATPKPSLARMGPLRSVVHPTLPSLTQALQSVAISSSPRVESGDIVGSSSTAILSSSSSSLGSCPAFLSTVNNW